MAPVRGTRWTCAGVDSIASDYIPRPMAPVSWKAFLLGLWIMAASAALATAPPEVERLPCLPLEGNGAVRATVPEAPGAVEVRLYFRRLDPRGAFYYDRMIAAGEGAW